MLSEHQDLADAYSGCVTGRVWASEATVAPVIDRSSAVQAAVHVHCRPRGLPCTLGDGPVCVFQEEAKSPTSHLIARLGLKEGTRQIS